MLMNNIFPETRLNGLHFCVGVVSCKRWQKSLEIATKTPYAGSSFEGHSSFKVIQFVTNRKGISDLLLVGTSARISHGFGGTVSYWSKSRLWQIPVSSNATDRGDALRICWWTLYCQKLEPIDTGQWRRHHSTFIPFDTIPAYDGQTDRQKCCT